MPGITKRPGLQSEFSRQKSLATRVLTDTTTSADPVSGMINVATMNRIAAVFRKLDKNRNGVLDRGDFTLNSLCRRGSKPRGSGSRLLHSLAKHTAHGARSYIYKPYVQFVKFRLYALASCTSPYPIR